MTESSDRTSEDRGSEWSFERYWIVGGLAGLGWGLLRSGLRIEADDAFSTPLLISGSTLCGVIAGMVGYLTRHWEKPRGPGRNARFITSGAAAGLVFGLVFVLASGGSPAWSLLYLAIGAAVGLGLRLYD